MKRFTSIRKGLIFRSATSGNTLAVTKHATRSMLSHNQRTKASRQPRVCISSLTFRRLNQKHEQIRRRAGVFSNSYTRAVRLSF